MSWDLVAQVPTGPAPTRFVITDSLDERLVYIDAAVAPVPGSDLLTLMTCMPIGINSRRVLVTGHRVATTAAAQQIATAPPGRGFPWWAVIDGTALIVLPGVLLRRR